MKETTNLFQRFSQWLRNSLFVKLISIGIIILLLMIPVSMVRDLIRERAYLRESVQREISQKWGAPQVISGPVLTIPYLERLEDQEGKVKQVEKSLHLLPAELTIQGEMEEEVRRRGLYEAILYSTRLSLSGRFEWPDLAALNLSAEDVRWDQARLAIGLSDMVGIRNEITVDWAGQARRLQPGTDLQYLLPTGVSTSLPVIDPEAPGAGFSVELVLQGSDYLGFTPVGRQTQVALTSSWPSPSFDGFFLPDRRELADTGFVATWQVLDLNRNFPQQWKGDRYKLDGSDFGVRLLQPVDAYAKNTRTVKYAFFVVGLTFLLYFFFEILKKFHIHPFQYLLVGLAISLFYILLLSVSEHLGFDLAYLIAAVATIGLVVFYSAYVLRYRRLVIQLAGLLVLIYAFIFVVLQLEDFALLVGSVGLFLALATVMYLSRQVDWYGDEEEKQHP